MALETQLWLCRHNIAHFRMLLSQATDDDRRRILTDLLHLEEAKLRELLSQRDDGTGGKPTD